MKILLNGEPREIARRTLAEPLASSASASAIGRDRGERRLRPRRRSAPTRDLREGDRVEVLAPMQGG